MLKKLWGVQKTERRMSEGRVKDKIRENNGMMIPEFNF